MAHSRPSILKQALLQMNVPSATPSAACTPASGALLLPAFLSMRAEYILFRHECSVLEFAESLGNLTASFTCPWQALLQISSSQRKHYPAFLPVNHQWANERIRNCWAPIRHQGGLPRAPGCDCSRHISTSLQQSFTAQIFFPVFLGMWQGICQLASKGSCISRLGEPLQ